MKRIKDGVGRSLVIHFFNGMVHLQILMDRFFNSLEKLNLYSYPGKESLCRSNST